MKKILILFLCLFFSVSVKAECTDRELLKWAREVEIKYADIVDDDLENAYYLYVSPKRENLYIEAKNDLYPGSPAYGQKLPNGEYGIASRIHFETKTYEINIYASKDSKECPNELLVTKTLSVPQYNSYNKSAFCEQFPESKLCETMSDVNDLTTEEFEKEAQEYAEKKNPQKQKEQNIIVTIIFDYLVWIIIPAAIVGIIYRVKIKKVRRVKNEK